MKKIYNHKYFWGYTLLIVSIILLILSFLLKSAAVNKASLSHQTKVLQKKIHQQEKDFAKLLQDTAVIKRIASGNENKNDLAFGYEKPYFFYLYKKINTYEFLRFWNTGQLILPDSVLHSNAAEHFVQLANGYYYIKKQRVPYLDSVSAYCAILIKSVYFVTTHQLNETYPHNTRLDKTVDISSTPTPYVIKSSGGKVLLFLKQKPYTNISSASVILVVMRIVGLFLVCLSVYFLLYRRFNNWDRAKDIFTFVGSLLLFRLAMYFFKNNLKLNDFYLFDSQIYGSSILLPTLGDLLVNALLFCWIMVFIWQRAKPDAYNIRVGRYKGRWLLGISSIMALVYATFSITNVIRSIISDSQISFDVTNFFSLKVYTAVGFVILACLSLGYYYLTRLLYGYIFSSFYGNIYLVYIITGAFGLLYVGGFANVGNINFYIACLAWLLLYTFAFNNEERIHLIIRFNISGIIVWISIFSISISLLMLSEIKKSELAKRKTYVEKLATQTDPSTEMVINIGNKYLDADFFVSNFHRLYDSNQNLMLRDSIANTNYMGYMNNYNTTLYFYDSLNNPMYNPRDLTLESLNTIINAQSKPTSQPDLFFYETDFDKFAYITRRTIKDNLGKLVGNVFIISDPKKFSVSEISPELFRQFSEWQFSNSTVYNYAIYNNKLLVSSSKKYPFTSTLVSGQLPKSKFEIRNNNGYSELWYRVSNHKVIVLARKNETILETITLFSYIFCSFLFLLALIQLLTILLGVVLNKRFFKRRLILSSSIRGQIHSTFILITVLSFIVIGIVTISFFTDRFENSNADRLGRTMNIMLNELQSHKDLGSLIFDQRSKKDSINSNELNGIIKRVAEIHGLDANIYDVTGRLLASSQPDIYTKGVLSKQMDPRAFYALGRLRHIEHIQQEKISNVKYAAIYAPIRNNDGSLNGYLSIPYFTSQQELNQEISSFLVTLINLNAFIFLITGLVALLITNRITRSFMLISDKMKQINLSKNNEIIEWDKNDEIGGLVTEYNKMVEKLQASADALARTERQDAWREMARQVAHEIKNPLTPMKLSLQYLQKAINDESPNTRQLTASVSKTLVEQIDHLSKIAADFSQFANINNAHKEHFDLHEVLHPLLTLYSKNPGMQFTWQPLPHAINIYADKTQMNRLFTNLFVNAAEACEGVTDCRIWVREKIDGENITIEIEDNGSGISDDMKNKIFTPNFTTKTSGTGLGLAMCKNIVDIMGGHINFDTKPGNGTTFYVVLPLAK